MAEKRYKSGAQKRREQKERTDVARENERRRQADESAKSDPYAGLERPPLSAAANIAWANSVAAAMLDEVIHDKQLTAEQRWKIGADLVAKIGMTHSRAATEERIARLEKALGMAKADKDDGGLQPDPEGSVDPARST